MILTCPECATSYFVDEDRIPRQGRMVRCSTCGARWRALPEGESEPEEDLAAAPLDDIVAEPAPRAEPEPDLEFVAAAKPARAAKKKTSPALAVASAVIVLLALGVGGLIVMRQQVAGTIPGSAAAFAAIGLPVDTTGLVIEGVKFKPALVAGQPVLSVTGAIRNIRHQAVVSPPIRISLLDKAGKPLAGRVADPLPGSARVPPGAVRYFAINLPDPPANARQLEVRFDLTARRAVPATKHE
jgi:predicted Zn finger-like uncharacterized protein